MAFQDQVLLEFGLHLKVVMKRLHQENSKLDQRLGGKRKENLPGGAVTAAENPKCSSCVCQSHRLGAFSWVDAVKLGTNFCTSSNWYY